MDISSENGGTHPSTFSHLLPYSPQNTGLRAAQGLPMADITLILNYGEVFSFPFGFWASVKRNINNSVFPPPPIPALRMMFCLKNG